MSATIRGWGRPLLALATLMLLTACTLGREPAYDAAIAGQVTDLTAETLRLFQDLAPDSASGFEQRAPRYRALAARAETIRLMAEARGSATAPTGLSRRLAQLGAGIALAEQISPKAAKRLDEYRDATAAYMADYLRNLRQLEAEDRAASGNHAERAQAYQQALAAHRKAVEDYLDAFALWQAGKGPQPAEPGPAPAAPRFGLDPDRLALRVTALEDVLRDALVYERDILNRDR